MGKSQEDMKKLFLDRIEDKVGELLYYDWNDDDDLTQDEVRGIIESGIVTKEEIIEEFTKQLSTSLD